MRNLIHRMINLTSFASAFVASIGAANRLWISCN